MALTTPFPLYQMQVSGHSSSLGSTPTVGYMRVPFRGKVIKVGVVQAGAVSGSSTVTFAINGTNITGGVATVTGGSAGTGFTATPTGANTVVEDDVISATPAGGGGTTISGNVWALIRKT